MSKRFFFFSNPNLYVLLCQVCSGNFRPHVYCSFQYNQSFKTIVKIFVLPGNCSAYSSESSGWSTFVVIIPSLLTLEKYLHISYVCVDYCAVSLSVYNTLMCHHEIVGDLPGYFAQQLWRSRVYFDPPGPGDTILLFNPRCIEWMAEWMDELMNEGRKEEINQSLYQR